MVTIKFLQEVGELTFNKGWKYLQRGGGDLTRKVWRKNIGGRGCLILKETMNKDLRTYIYNHLADLQAF